MQLVRMSAISLPINQFLSLRCAGKFIFSTYGANPMSAAAACAVRLHLLFFA